MLFRLRPKGSRWMLNSLGLGACRERNASAEHGPDAITFDLHVSSTAACATKAMINIHARVLEGYFVQGAQKCCLAWGCG